MTPEDYIRHVRGDYRGPALPPALPGKLILASGGAKAHSIEIPSDIAAWFVAASGRAGTENQSRPGTLLCVNKTLRRPVGPFASVTVAESTKEPGFWVAQLMADLTTEPEELLRAWRAVVATPPPEDEGFAEEDTAEVEPRATAADPERVPLVELSPSEIGEFLDTGKLVFHFPDGWFAVGVERVVVLGIFNLGGDAPTDRLWRGGVRWDAVKPEHGSLDVRRFKEVQADALLSDRAAARRVRLQRLNEAVERLGACLEGGWDTSMSTDRARSSMLALATPTSYAAPSKAEGDLERLIAARLPWIRAALDLLDTLAGLAPIEKYLDESTTSDERRALAALARATLPNLPAATTLAMVPIPAALAARSAQARAIEALLALDPSHLDALPRRALATGWLQSYEASEGSIGGFLYAPELPAARDSRDAAIAASILGRWARPAAVAQLLRGVREMSATGGLPTATDVEAKKQAVASLEAARLRVSTEIAALEAERDAARAEALRLQDLHAQVGTARTELADALEAQATLRSEVVRERVAAAAAAAARHTEQEAAIGRLRGLAALEAELAGSPRVRGEPVPLRNAEHLREILAGHGLRYATADVRRFLHAALAARQVGALVLLAGPTGSGKTRLVETCAHVLVDASIARVAVRPEWLGASDLLGFFDPMRRVPTATAFVASVRSAAARARPVVDEHDAQMLAPAFVLLDELNLARVENFGADLLSALERATDRPGDADAIERRALEIFPELVATELREEMDTTEDVARKRVLERVFSVGEPHLLHLPQNLCLTATLNTDRHTHDLSPKVFDRSFVLQVAEPDAAGLFAGAPAFDGSFCRLPPARAPTRAAWDRHAELRVAFLSALEALRGVGVVRSHRMVRNAAAYLDSVDSFDAPPKWQDLCEDLLRLVVLPRLECAAPDAEKALVRLHGAVSSWAPETLKAHVNQLSGEARAAGRGEFRGLR